MSDVIIPDVAASDVPESVEIIVDETVEVRMEQVAGYYACKECGHRYVPTYRTVAMAPHMGRTRYMRCPQCEKKSWQKKVLSKE